MQAIKRLRAPLIMIFGVMLAIVGFAGPASAAPYSNQATISVSNQTPNAGSTIRVCGLGFGRSEAVLITLNQTRRVRGTRLAVAFTNRSGAFCTRINVGNRIGTETITARGIRSGRTASATIRVIRKGELGVTVLGVSATTGTSANTAISTISATPAASGLAFTGANAIGLSAIAVLLLLGGGAMVVVGKRGKVNV
jgi:hypothetical protein